jgi:hypothetical protein
MNTTEVMIQNLTDDVQRLTDERDEARKAARSLLYAVLCKEIPRKDISTAALEKWPWLKEGEMELI